MVIDHYIIQAELNVTKQTKVGIAMGLTKRPCHQDKHMAVNMNSYWGGLEGVKYPKQKWLNEYQVFGCIL